MAVIGNGDIKAIVAIKIGERHAVGAFRFRSKFNCFLEGAGRIEGDGIAPNPDHDEIGVSIPIEITGGNVHHPPRARGNPLRAR